MMKFLVSFNSNMVRLDEKSDLLKQNRAARFNSNMVRLDAVIWLKLRFHLRFQFQYGAIRCIKGKVQDVNHILFQFQYGAIR